MNAMLAIAALIWGGWIVTNWLISGGPAPDESSAAQAGSYAALIFGIALVGAAVYELLKIVKRKKTESDEVE